MTLIDTPAPSPKMKLSADEAAAALVKRTRRSLTICLNAVRTTREIILNDLGNNADGLSIDGALLAFSDDDAGDLATLLDAMAGLVALVGLKATDAPQSLYRNRSVSPVVLGPAVLE